MEKRSVIRYVKKRDGSIVPFDRSKIKDAILKAMHALNLKNEKQAQEVTEEVVKSLTSEVPTVEQIQNAVEQILEKNDIRLFKIYSLYRRQRAHARDIKEFFKIRDDLKFTANALKVLEERYLLKDINGKIIETPTEMFRRVAKVIAQADVTYGKKKNEIVDIENQFFEIMKNLEFLPNTPTLMNAGTPLGQLSACFVLPIDDNLNSIFNTLKDMAIIQQSGGGTGFSFSKLRPEGDIVKSTRGVASGPVSFIKIFDATTEVIKQGGKRRGANMAVLDVSHPDVEKFILSKQGSQQLSNFNISVGVTDEFMKDAVSSKPFHLINPHTNKTSSTVDAKKLFDKICSSAWQTGDPGIIFIDEINRKHTLQSLGKIEATNPCGEVPLLSYESCNLGSINLSKMVKDNKIDFEKLKSIVHLAVHFLDNVIDMNKYPLPEIEQLTKANRKIGLGIMGFADMLIKLGISYNSQNALNTAEKLMAFISKEARVASLRLGKERGSFPNFRKSSWKSQFSAMRNATCTTIAPTGSISTIAGCSSGIEPLFAIAYVREIMEGKRLIEINQLFQLEAIQKNFYKDNIIRKITETGSIQKTNLPKEIKSKYITALEISPEWHVRMQAVFQKYTDNAVSKTVNLPENATINDIKKIYLLAHKLKCKGITAYRYNSKPAQVLYIGKGKNLTTAEIHYSGGPICAECAL